MKSSWRRNKIPIRSNRKRKSRNSSYKPRAVNKTTRPSGRTNLKTNWSRSRDWTALKRFKSQTSAMTEWRPSRAAIIHSHPNMLSLELSKKWTLSRARCSSQTSKRPSRLKISICKFQRNKHFSNWVVVWRARLKQEVDLTVNKWSWERKISWMRFWIALCRQTVITWWIRPFDRPKENSFNRASRIRRFWLR